jgi:carbon-monoxide dehydrogenase large subunit
MKWTGKPVKRVEDPRFITGRAAYLDDITLPRLCHAKFLRSTYARARIKRIDASKALQVPGVLAVLIGADLRPYNQF